MRIGDIAAVAVAVAIGCRSTTTLGIAVVLRSTSTALSFFAESTPGIKRPRKYAVNLIPLPRTAVVVVLVASVLVVVVVVGRRHGPAGSIRSWTSSRLGAKANFHCVNKNRARNNFGRSSTLPTDSDSKCTIA